MLPEIATHPAAVAAQPERSPFFFPAGGSSENTKQKKNTENPMPQPPLRTVHLRRSSPPAAAAIAVEEGGGVNLARVGRALGLDPATVRLNGYFLSSGTGHVSTAVKWRALLAFFASRGLPTGADPDVPVAVIGRPAPQPSRPDHTVLQISKRKPKAEAENCYKKSKLQDNSLALPKYGDDLLSDDITLGFKRRLRLDETSPSKKIKQVEFSSVNGAETRQPIKFSCSLINGHGKRPRDEMATSLLCKRVR